MNKTLARILALGVAVALPTGLIGQSTSPRPVDKPETTAPASSSTTDTKNLETRQPGKKSTRKSKKSGKKSVPKKSDDAKTETKPSGK
jgi:hypothetical protein